MKESQSSRTAMHALFVLALVFLAFVGGALAAAAEMFPATFVRTAYRAGTAYYAKLSARHERLNSDLWAPARTARMGVLATDEDRLQPGLTLYASADSARVHLIAPSGAVVYEWGRPYSEVWDRTAATRTPVPDKQVYLRRAHLFTDGSLLVIYEGAGDSPYGYGLAKLDRNSNVVWKNLDHFHHDFSVAGDGLIYGLTHRYRNEPLADADHFVPPLTEDFLVAVSPVDGRTVMRISLLEAFRNSEYFRMLWLVPYSSLEDPLHANAVEYLDSKTAAQLAKTIPTASAGQVLLSLRELGNGVIALLDPAQEKIVWATRGPWHAQHDPDVLPNGNVLMFDNLGHYGRGGQSRIIEFNPLTSAIEWMYTGDAQDKFESLIRGSQERLPNGNTLIVESQAGRVFEVTAAGEIVWDFVVPVRAGRNNAQLPIVSWAQRIDAGVLALDFQQILFANLRAKEMESE